MEQLDAHRLVPGSVFVLTICRFHLVVQYSCRDPDLKPVAGLQFATRLLTMETARTVAPSSGLDLLCSVRCAVITMRTLAAIDSCAREVLEQVSCLRRAASVAMLCSHRINLGTRCTRRGGFQEEACHSTTMKAALLLALLVLSLSSSSPCVQHRPLSRSCDCRASAGRCCDR